MKTEHNDYCMHSHCLHVEGLGVNIGRRKVLEDISFYIDCGELISIVGPNGAGKTTLLRAILDEVPKKGKVNFCAQKHFTEHRRIGYVPQKLNFDPDSPVSVLDLMASAFTSSPISLGISAKIREKAKDALSKVSLEHVMNRKIGELSGGEIQRVLLALAVTPFPDLLLLDEPISGVDARGLKIFYEKLNTLRKENGVSVIMVTHDIAGVIQYADRVLLLNRKVIAEGKPRDVLSQETAVKVLGVDIFNFFGEAKNNDGTVV